MISPEQERAGRDLARQLQQVSVSQCSLKGLLLSIFAWDTKLDSQ